MSNEEGKTREEPNGLPRTGVGEAATGSSDGKTLYKEGNETGSGFLSLLIVVTAATAVAGEIAAYFGGASLRGGAWSGGVVGLPVAAASEIAGRMMRGTAREAATTGRSGGGAADVRIWKIFAVSFLVKLILSAVCVIVLFAFLNRGAALTATGVLVAVYCSGLFREAYLASGEVEKQ